MDASDLLLELYGRVPPLVGAAVEDLDGEDLARSPSPGANSIGWLVWHLTRVQDSHIAELLDVPQIWVNGDWAQRIGVDPDPHNSGYGHTREQMEQIRPEGPEVLVDYMAAVDDRTREFVTGLSAPDFDRIVDRNWDPPVTMGVRLASIADDCLQHAGQASYVRGMLGI